MEVIERIGRAPFPDVEGDQGGRGDGEQPDCHGPLARDHHQVDGDDEGTDQEDREHAAGVVHRLRGLVDVGGDEPERHEQGEPGERQGEQERGPPREVLEQDAGEQGAERRERSARGGPERDRLRSRRTRPERCDQRQGGRIGHARRKTADDPRPEEHADRGSEGRDEVGRDRQGHPHEQDPLAAVAIADRAEVENGAGEPEGVGDCDQVEIGLRSIEMLADVGQGDVRNRQTQIGDGGDGNQGGKHPPRPSGSRRRRCSGRRRRLRAGRRPVHLMLEGVTEAGEARAAYVLSLA